MNQINEPVVVKLDAPGYHVQAMLSKERLERLLRFLAVLLLEESKQQAKKDE